MDGSDRGDAIRGGGVDHSVTGQKKISSIPEKVEGAIASNRRKIAQMLRWKGGKENGQ
jgi:hypothetical protein